MWPYDGLRFVSNPTKITIGGQDKITAELEGYFIYVCKLWWGTRSIGKWYPYDPTETDNKAKIGFSTYFKQVWNTSVNETNNSELSIFPNPAQSNLILEMNDNEPINGWAKYDMTDVEEFSLFTFSGKQLPIEITNSDKFNFTINTGNLPKGVFLLKTKTKSHTTEKM